MAHANDKEKSSIHPNYREIKVIMTNKEEFVTRSTYSKDEMLLDVDKHTHPAWSKADSFVNTKADAITKFQKKYGSMNFSALKKKSASEAAESK